MLLPTAWLRKQRLTKALQGYPVYDPPHKVEERVLPKEKALQNFDYFMRVRLERVKFFGNWLQRNFSVVIPPDKEGVASLNRWMVRYGGLLLPNDTVAKSYFTYDPPWTGEAAGCNVVFDIGTTFGEFIIANCPKLRWDMDPISAIRPNEARSLKRGFGSSFQRPMLTGFDNPNWGKIPLHDTYIYACQLKMLTTFSGITTFYDPVGIDRYCYTHRLPTIFEGTLREYQAGDPRTLYGPTDIPTGISLDPEDDDD